MLSVGLMSGTSMDGIEAALLETNGTPTLLNERGAISLAYDPRFSLFLRAAEYAIRKAYGEVIVAKVNFKFFLHEFCQTHHIEFDWLTSYFKNEEITYEMIERHSTELHAKCVQQLLAKENYCTEQIEVIGYHGQTLYHQPEKKCSIMLGDPQYLADLLKIKVIYDFRRKDIEAGGQGAPFAPLYHQALAIRDNQIPLAIVNCGGISNITLILGEEESDVIGFDTGPGNGLIDSLVRLRTQGREGMDKDGKYGLNGRVNEEVLHALYDKAVIKQNRNYFHQMPPKSLDYADLKLIPELNNLSLEDACRTLEIFTAYSIVDALKWIESPYPTHWIVAGGGWVNPVIKTAFEARLKEICQTDIKVKTADEVGWHAKALEAQIFAYFAVRSLLNKPLSMPKTTNVPYPLSGGSAFVPSVIPENGLTAS